MAASWARTYIWRARCEITTDSNTEFYLYISNTPYNSIYSIWTGVSICYVYKRIMVGYSNTEVVGCASCRPATITMDGTCPSVLSTSLGSRAAMFTCSLQWQRGPKDGKCVGRRRQTSVGPSPNSTVIWAYGLVGRECHATRPAQPIAGLALDGTVITFFFFEFPVKSISERLHHLLGGHAVLEAVKPHVYHGVPVLRPCDGLHLPVWHHLDVHTPGASHCGWTMLLMRGTGDLADVADKCTLKVLWPFKIQNVLLLNLLNSLVFSEQLSEQEDLIVWMRTAALPTSFTIYWVHFSSQKG
jgi:hypothetical protein